MRARDDEILADLADFAATAARIVRRGEAAYFDPEDDILRRAARSVIIDVASAVAQLSPERRARLPEADAIIGMRNRVAHSYWSVNDRVVWNTLRHVLPELVRTLGIETHRDDQ